MLTDFNVEIILQFQHRLKRLQTELESATTPHEAFPSQWHEIQETFEQQIMTLTPSASTANFLAIWQSYLTEMHRQMRLIAIDLRFLKAARQTTTAQTRRKQTRERLQILIQYCDAILTKLSSE